MSSGSSLSPSGWIQTANRFTSTATWAAYSSALAALTLNQMNGSPSTSPTQPPDSPPYDYFSYGVKRSHSGGVKRSKSFTIDAILGLRRDVAAAAAASAAAPADDITSPSSSSTTCFNFSGSSQSNHSVNTRNQLQLFGKKNMERNSFSLNKK